MASYSSVARAERDEQCRTGPSKGFDLMAKNLDLEGQNPIPKEAEEGEEDRGEGGRGGGGNFDAKGRTPGIVETES